jgi:hypothetical protein
MRAIRIAGENTAVKNCEDHSPELSRALLAGWQAPDLLGIGVVVCDASCRMLIANQTALDILAARDGLWLNSDGQLLATDEAAQTVADLVQRCSNGGVSARVASRGCLSATLHRASGRSPLALLARPFRSTNGGPGAMTLLLLLDFPRAIAEDGVAPLLHLLTTSQSSRGSNNHRERVQ